MQRAAGGDASSTNGDPSSAACVAAALEAALQARAAGVHASTPMVRQLAAKVGRELGFDARARALLDVAVRVRDIGMIALPDGIVNATAPLTPADWKLVNQHPVLGEQLLEPLHVVAPAAAIVRSHHERWDGGGYPDELRGDAIPLASRVIATCDAFVAMACDRPHRRGMGAEAALERVLEDRGTQFDPAVVDGLHAALAGDGRPPARAAHVNGAKAARRNGADGGARGLRDLKKVIAEFDPVPVFAPAHERALAVMTTHGTSRGELVAAIETDTGLTIATLRRAQSVPAKQRIANVSDAVAALTPAEIEEAFDVLPRVDFPWRTSPLELLMHRSRLHAQAVARAADRIAREVRPAERDDILVAALLHDIGKLALSRTLAERPTTPERTTTPEERIRQEQRALGMDHASLGGRVLDEWGLPDRLSSTVASHHRAESADEVATYVRLADMVAHHVQGDAVDRRTMLRLAGVCGLSGAGLRDVLFDLPHAGGSQRRRADPSPLTKRETAILRVLAEGKVYKEIAVELGVAASTIRTHLHNMYSKLGVDDRAQAVLRATEMGWI